MVMQSHPDLNMLDPEILQDISDSQEAIHGFNLEPITLITGSTGLIGSFLAEFYLGILMQSGLNLEIVLCARKFDANSERLRVLGNGKVKLVTIDELSEYLCTNHLPIHVIHAASPAAVNNYLDNPLSLVETNISLTTILCEHLRKVGGHFTFMSSGEVYGHSPKIPTPENFEGVINHLGESFGYAQSKRTAEFILKSYACLDTFGVSVFRIYHAFGPGIRANDTRIFATAINSVIDGLDVVLRSDGQSTRGFIYMGDVARAVLKKPFINNFSLYNLCGSKEISIYEFAKMACDLSNGNSQVKFDTSGIVDSSSNNQIKRGFADTSLIRSTGWLQKISIEEGIARSIRSGFWRRGQI
jgi:nucleoside-diphosphate-sugar epimerase